MFVLPQKITIIVSLKEAWRTKLVEVVSDTVCAFYTLI